MRRRIFRWDDHGRANYTSDSSTGEAAEESGKRPIIIAIMNESFTDLGVLGDFESDSYLANWYAERSYVRRGYVYSSVYGGGTCNSEFEFLTGDSIANIQAGAYPYENYDLTETENIVKYLRDAEGYYTVAFHPYKADNWNRPEAYEALGFDIFLTQDDVEDPEHLASKISDASDYAKVEELLDEAQMTPYMIWTNFDTGTEQREENMSINYLGATLMDVAGYHTTYTNYLLEL